MVLVARSCFFAPQSVEHLVRANVLRASGSLTPWRDWPDGLGRPGLGAGSLASRRGSLSERFRLRCGRRLLWHSCQIALRLHTHTRACVVMWHHSVRSGAGA